MKLLLDTHVLIWLAEGMPDLPEGSRRLIDAAADTHGLAVSAISFWEVAMLATGGRISLSQPIEHWRGFVITTPGIAEAPVTGEVGIEAVRLPGTFHDDPVDRMIVATARLNGWQIATRDQRILGYGAAGHVRTARV